MDLAKNRKEFNCDDGWEEKYIDTCGPPHNDSQSSRFDYLKDRINYIYNPIKKITIIPQAVDIQYDKIEIKEKDYYVWVGKLRKIKC